MPRLAAARDAHAAGVPLIGPSLVDAGNRSRIPRDLPGLFNGHPYSGGAPPEPALSQALVERRATTPRRRAVFTETGYHNALQATTGQAPVSEAAAAIYMPAAAHGAFGAGVRRTFLYELVDEKPDPASPSPSGTSACCATTCLPSPRSRRCRR